MLSCRGCWGIGQPKLAALCVVGGIVVCSVVGLLGCGWFAVGRVGSIVGGVGAVGVILFASFYDFRYGRSGNG